MKLHQYGKWTIYVILDPEDKRRGYKSVTIYDHHFLNTLPPKTLMFAHINNAKWDHQDYVSDLGEDPDVKGHARYVLHDAIKSLQVH